MTDFKVIPVIDILNSETVHAIKGERDKYKPLETDLTKSSNPLDLMSAIQKTYSLNEFYIADLDSIIKNEPNIKLINQILQNEDLNLMLDPGIKSLDDLELFVSTIKIDQLIFGIETIKSLDIISRGIERIGRDKLIVSIDLYKGKIISEVPEIKCMNPIQIVKELNDFNIKKIILLDLFRVGQKLGGIPNLYLKIKNIFRGNILVGGGLKNYNDIKKFYENRFSGVLVGTAIYDGTIKPKDIKNLL